MRMRFTIRDLLWLTLVVALAAGWWREHRRMTQRKTYPHAREVVTGVVICPFAGDSELPLSEGQDNAQPADEQPAHFSAPRPDNLLH
jgi:hypothetical protein